MRRLTSFLALLLVVGNHLVAQSQPSADLWAGTRHLAISKSTFRDGSAPKERTFVIENVDGGIRGMVTGTEADGTTLNFSYTVKFDGQYSATAGAGAGDSISFRRLGARRLESRHKVGAKVDVIGTFVLSKDGSVVTLTFTKPDGKPSNVLVFEK